MQYVRYDMVCERLLSRTGHDVSINMYITKLTAPRPTWTVTTHTNWQVPGIEARYPEQETQAYGYKSNSCLVEAM